MVIDIDITPTWDAAARIYLEVLRVNDWWSAPSKEAKKEILRMAEALDKVNKYTLELRKKNDSIK